MDDVPSALEIVSESWSGSAAAAVLKMLGLGFKIPGNGMLAFCWPLLKRTCAPSTAAA